MDLKAPGRIHFVGIGGAGMSAIAKILLERGYEVSGSDLKRSREVTMLEAMGANVAAGHDPGLIDGASAVVVSSAIPATNPELHAARDRGVEVLSRGEALARVLEGKRSVIVAGTHGKTTTTSMIVSILRSAGLDPTYLVGAGLNDVGTNARQGTGDLAVAESDESDGSFLLLEPEIAVVTNVEEDHLDHWGTFESLRQAFVRFLERVQPGGSILVPAPDSFLCDLARRLDRKVLTFGVGVDADVSASGVELGQGQSSFVVRTRSESATARLQVPGTHNVANATAAVAAALCAGVPLADAVRALSFFRGVERRFQVRGKVGGATVVDDYAHHPSEVRATLAAARGGSWRRVVAVFQPHRYSRTAALHAQFGPAFADADRVVVTEVYGAGEHPVPGVTGKLIAESVCKALPGRPVAYLPRRAELVSYLRRSLRPGDIVLTLGAGDVSSLGDDLLSGVEVPA